MLSYPAPEIPFEHALPPSVYEPDICLAIDKFVRPGDVVIDAGANVGFFSIYSSCIVGEEGVVFAFEPFLEAYRHLIYNVHAHYKRNNIACYKTALWSHDMPELLLNGIDGYTGYTSAFVRYTGDDYPAVTEIVEARALDTVLGRENHPRFIKIDVEGAELEVLQGAKRILERGVDCIALELNYDILDNMGRKDTELRSFMLDLGYDMFLINAPPNVDTPAYVDPKWWIDVRRGSLNQRHINVMFSTRAKVDALWKIDSTSALSTTCAASSKTTSSPITSDAAA